MREYTLSASGAALIQQREGLRLKVYTCSAGVWTIGYGATRGMDGKPLTRRSARITQADAEYLFNRDKFRYENGVNKVLNVDVPQGAFDALVSLTYNIGRAGFAGSSCLRLLNNGDVDRAGLALLLWNKVTRNGKKVISQGLKNRRHSEWQQYVDAYAVPRINNVPAINTQQEPEMQGLDLSPQSSLANAVDATRAIKYADVPFLSLQQLTEFADAPFSLIANCLDKKAIGEMREALIDYDYAPQEPTDPNPPTITGQRLVVVFNGKYHSALTGWKVKTTAMPYHDTDLVKQVQVQYKLAEAVLKAYYKKEGTL